MALPRHESETQTTGGGSTDELLVRGNLLLQSLASEAQAARLEAKRAELELAMAEAKAGNSAHLSRCLALHGEISDTALSRNTAAATARGDHSESTSPATAAVHSFDSAATSVNPWHGFLPHARERLLARAAELRHAESEPNGTRPPSGSEVRQAASESQATEESKQSHQTTIGSSEGVSHSVALTRPAERPAPDRRRFDPAQPVSQRPKPHKRNAMPVEPDSLASRGNDTTTPQVTPARAKLRESVKDRDAAPRLKQQTNRQDSASRPSAVAISKQFAQPAPDTVESRYRAVLRTLASGMGVSMIFHVLVVIVLMILTLKLPQPPASLAFETSAVEPVTETLEIMQPAEPSQPIDESVPEPTPLDVSLPNLSDPALQQMMQQPTNSVAKSLTSSLATSSRSSASEAINKASATFFGAAARGNSFCYIVDSSGSMRGGAWEAAKNELMRSLTSLTEKQRFYIIFFAQEFHAIPAQGEREPSDYALYATRENIDHARRWIDTIQIERGAPPNDAIEFAIPREPDAIYLLTDGVTKVDVIGFLRRVNRTEDIINGQRAIVPIHTIAFYSLDGQQLLRQIAAENQGQFIYVPNPRVK